MHQLLSQLRSVNVRPRVALICYLQLNFLNRISLQPPFLWFWARAPSKSRLMDDVWEETLVCVSQFSRLYRS